LNFGNLPHQIKSLNLGSK